VRKIQPRPPSSDCGEVVKSLCRRGSGGEKIMANTKFIDGGDGSAIEALNKL